MCASRCLSKEELVVLDGGDGDQSVRSCATVSCGSFYSNLTVTPPSVHRRQLVPLSMFRERSSLKFAFQTFRPILYGLN